MTFMNSKTSFICRTIRNGVSGCRKAAIMLQNDLRGNTMRIFKLLKLLKGLDFTITTEMRNGRESVSLVIQQRGQTVILHNVDLIDVEIIAEDK